MRTEGNRLADRLRDLEAVVAFLVERVLVLEQKFGTKDADLTPAPDAG